MTTSGHADPRATISTTLRCTENSSVTSRRCAGYRRLVARLQPARRPSRWCRRAARCPPGSSTRSSRPGRCSAPISPSCAIAAWVLDARDTVPRSPRRLAIRAQTVPAVMRTWMRERSRPPTSISRTVTSEFGSIVTVVPSRKVTRARLGGRRRMQVSHGQARSARSGCPPAAVRPQKLHRATEHGQGRGRRDGGALSRAEAGV